MNLETAIRENTAALIALRDAMLGDARRATCVPETEEAEEAPESLDYEADVKPLVIKLAAEDKPKVIEILAGFGATRGGDVLPRLLPQLKEQLEAALNG